MQFLVMLKCHAELIDCWMILRSICIFVIDISWEFFFFPNQFGLILGGLVSSLAHGKSGGIMDAFFWLIGSYQSSTF